MSITDVSMTSSPYDHVMVQDQYMDTLNVKNVTINGFVSTNSRALLRFTHVGVANISKIILNAARGAEPSYVVMFTNATAVTLEDVTVNYNMSGSVFYCSECGTCA